MSPVDLRSDTVTRPTPAMRRRMAEAEVGDDVMREDPTVEALQARVAGLFGKEAALFFPSGTMSNLAAVLAWCDARGSEVVVGDRSHLFLFEQAGACQFGGVSMRTVPNLPDGTMDVERGVRPAVRDWPPDVHEPATRLIAVENTHCSCGGAALPGAFLRDLQVFLSGCRLRRHPKEIGGLRRRLRRGGPSLVACMALAWRTCMVFHGVSWHPHPHEISPHEIPMRSP